MASETNRLFITYVVQERDLLKIWGQKTRSYGLFIDQKLSELEREFVNSRPPSVEQFYRGMFCFAKYKDNSYYRARVISEVQGSMIRVFFVDFGNKDYVEISDIRVDTPSSTLLTKIDDQADSFILAKVVAPLGGWSKEVMTDLKQRLCYEEVPYRLLGIAANERIIQILVDNQDFSSVLIHRKIAREVALDTQRNILTSYLAQFPNDTNRQTNSFPNPPPGIQPNFTPNLSQAQPVQSDRPTLVNMPPKQGTYRQVPEPQINARVSIPQTSAPVNSMNIPVSTPNIPVSSNALFSPTFNAQQIKDPSLAFNGGMSPMVNPLAQMNPMQQMNPFSSVMMEALAAHLKKQIVEDTLKAQQETPPTPTPQNFEQPVLEVGSAHNVYVSYVEDGPWSFSIQLCENEGQLDKLRARISTAKLIPIKRPITLGRPCLAKSEEMKRVQRGIVVNVTHHCIRVNYVDYGNSEDIPVSHVYEIPPELLQVKAFSYKFALCGLQKVPASPDIKECFKEVVFDQIIMLRVTSLEGESLPTCELYLNEKNVKRILNDSLKLLRLMSPEPFPDVGTTEKAMVTWVETPTKFFVQLKKRERQLDELKRELAEFAAKGEYLTPDQLKIGQACVCLYSGDQNWYRAMISSVESEDAITVFYVDYGNVDTVSMTNLRKMEYGNLISRMNTQALRCCLQDFVNRPFTDEISNCLEDMIMEKTVDLRVLSHEKEHIVVKLFEGGKDIGQALLHPPKQEYARFPVPPHSPPREQAYPPKLTTPTPAHEVEDWGEIKSEERPNFGGGRSSNRNDDRNFNKSDDRDRFNRPRRFNDNEDDSQNKRPFSARNKDKKGKRRTFEVKDDRFVIKTSNLQQRFDRARGYPQEDRNKDGDFRSNRRQEEQTNDWDQGKNSNDYNDRHQRSENNFSDRGGDRPNFRDRGGDRPNFGDRGGDRSNFGDRGGDRPRFNDRGNFERKKRFSGGEDDKKSNDGWDNKPKEDNWGSKSKDNDDWGSKPKNDDWGSKPRGERSFGDRPERPERPKLYPVRNEAAPEGSQWADEYIDPGTKHKTIIPFFISPSEFYVKLADDPQDFKTMMQEIQTYYTDKFWMRDPKVGDICIAKYKLDRVLYRAQVIGTSPINVVYVDYGNTGEVHPKDIFPVKRDYLDLPKQAFKCKLQKISPLGDSWSEDFERFFSSEAYICHFVSQDMENKIFEVDLELDGKDVAQEIIAAGLAAPCAGGAAAAEPAQGATAAEPAQGEAEAEAVQDTLIPTLDLSLLVNQTLNFTIIHMETLSEFYVHVYPADVEIIQDKINAFIAEPQNFVQLGRDNFQEGLICISTNGEHWFRAKILQVTETGALVQFVDYGDCAEVTDDQVVIISDELANLPAQAVQCSLYQAPGEIDETVVEEFKNSYVVGEVEIICLVNSVTDNRLILSLYDTEGNKLLKDINDSPAVIVPLRAARIAHQHVPVFMSHADGPSSIFIQRECDSDPIEKLQNELAEFYESERETFDPALPENESKLCAGKSLEDENWYRCRLISVAEGKATVQYIDYGNSEELPIENLRKLDAKYYETCCLAKQVSLYADFGEDKLEDATNKIFEIMEDKQLIAFFKVSDGVTYAEFLLDGVRITDLLIAEGLCTRKEDIFQELVTAQVPQVMASAPQQVVVESSAEAPEEPTTQVVEEVPVEGAGEAVTLTDVQSCSDFYVIKYADDEQMTKVTEELQNRVAEFEDVAVVKDGELYAAVFPDDGRWYRAKIVKSNDVTEVFFVDYGNKSVVTEVKKLPEDLAQLPFLAYNCELAYPANVCDWTEDSFAKFQGMVNKDMTMVVLLENNSKKFVSLTDSETGASVAETIIEPPETLLPEVYIVNVTSTAEFFVQYSDDSENLELVNDLVADAENFEDLEDKTPGTKCVAKFPDDSKWYRAVILSDSGDSCEVEFVDYGNVATVTEIKKSSEEIDATGKLAYRCGLPGATGNEPEAIQNEFAALANEGQTPFTTDSTAREQDQKIRIFWNGVDYGKYLLGKNVESAGEVAQGAVETDDDKIRVQGTTANETDEEKSVKARQSTEGTSEGFKSDDEKTETVTAPNFVNVPDNELIGEDEQNELTGQEQEESPDDSVQIIEEIVAEPQTPVSDSTEYLEVKPPTEDSIAESEIRPASEAGSLDSQATRESSYKPRSEASTVDSQAWDRTRFSELVPPPSTVNSSAWDHSVRDETIILDGSVEIQNAEEPTEAVQTETESEMNIREEEPAETFPVESETGVQEELAEAPAPESAMCMVKEEMIQPEESSFAPTEESDFNNFKNEAIDNDYSEEGEYYSLNSHPIKQEAQTPSDADTSFMNGNHHTSDESSPSPVVKKETEIKTDDANCSPILKPDAKFKPEAVGNSQTLPRKSIGKSREEKIVPGSISRGMSNEELELNTSTPKGKTPHSEKIIPGSISRGISFENVEYSDSQEEETMGRSSVSAPVTPSSGRKSYKKVGHQDRIIPGCVAGSPTPEVDSPVYEKKPPSERIIPGVVGGSTAAEK